MAKRIKQVQEEVKDTSVTINKEMSKIYDDNMSLYATEILTQRALPNLEDGLKDVHLKLAWSLYLMNLKHTGPTTKSIKVIGKCFNFYLHGDASCYGALVKMAQDFYLNQPLVIPQGSFSSSKTANSESSARYTEVKMSQYLETMLEYIDKSAEMVPNFDGTLELPKKIPTLMPNILINRSSGIAIGYADEFLPHNLAEACQAEIVRIKKPTCRLDTILQAMPGPDFNMGGTILNYGELKKAYETGIGKVTVRGDMEIDEKHHMIIVKSIPYDTYLDNLLHQLDLAVEKNIGIVDFADKSQCITNGGLYDINVEIYCDKKTDLNFIKDYLYKNTLLQTNLSINMMAVVDSKKPILCNLLFILDKLIEYHNNVLIKAYTYDLNKATIRKEIVEGLLRLKDKDLLNKIIKMIRSSKTRDEAKQKLIKDFKFTQLQAETILSTQLGRLVNTNFEQLELELKELIATIAECNKVINDKKYREEVLIAKLKSYQKMFPSERKTKIDFDPTHTGDISLKLEQIIPEGNKIILLSKQGFIKSTSEKSFNSSEHWTSALNLGLQDQIVTQAVVDNKDNLVALSSLGRALPIKVFKLKESPMKANALSLSDKFDVLLPNETVVYGLSQKPETDSVILFVSKHGQIKLMNFSSIPLTRQKWTEVMKLKNGDQIIFAGKCNPKSDNVCIVSKNGQILSFSLKDITIQGKPSGGMAGQKLKKDDEVISAFAFNPKAKAAMLVSTPNEAKWLPISEIPVGNRATQGVKVSPEKSMNIIGAVKLALPANKTQYIQAINNNDQTSWLLLENIPQKKLDQKMVKMTTGNLKSITVLENIGGKK